MYGRRDRECIHREKGDCFRERERERERGACNHKGLASACPKHCLTWARCYILFRAVKTKFDKKTFTANFVKIEM